MKTFIITGDINRHKNIIDNDLWRNSAKGMLIFRGNGHVKSVHNVLHQNVSYVTTADTVLCEVRT